MRAHTRNLLAAAGITSSALAQSNSTLASVCNVANVQAALPVVPGITFDPTSVTADAVTNTSITGSVMYPDGVIDFCNVTLTYSHDGLGDKVVVAYWLPAPSDFKNRFLSTGGGGYAINSGITTEGQASLPGGSLYGAVSGATDGGFGSFSTNFDLVYNAAGNGTQNLPSLYMFGYKAIHEMTVFGKDITKNFYAMGDSKLYAYYQGCSEGGRDGWSQVQRFGDQFDGVITGAPAFRFAHQQVQHLWTNVVASEAGYTPKTCELSRIVTAQIAACDALDGKVDGVVSRTDLCKSFNYNSTIGLSYACNATAGNPFGGSAVPAENGTVTAEAAAIAARSDAGIKDASGKQVYFSYQPAAASYGDATTSTNAANEEVFAVNSFGSEYVTRFIQKLNTNNFDIFTNVSGETLKEWIIQGWHEYEDTLQTTNPDLTPFHTAGGKILHYHGESDNSIPAASSIRYHDSVRTTMYPGASYNESSASLSEWYKLFLVPGAGHCSTNAGQANGPFPQTNLAVMIDWVENAIEPVTLNATHLAGTSVGVSTSLCAWPLRPQWSGNETVPSCVYDQASVDSFSYELDAFLLPVY